MQIDAGASSLIRWSCDWELSSSWRQREMPWQTEVSSITVHSPHKRITSILFSELLLHLFFLEIISSKNIIIQRHVFWSVHSATLHACFFYFTPRYCLQVPFYPLRISNSHELKAMTELHFFRLPIGEDKSRLKTEVCCRCTYSNTFPPNTTECVANWR